MILDRDARITSLIDSTFNLYYLKELRSFLDRECANDPDFVNRKSNVESSSARRWPVAADSRPPIGPAWPRVTSSPNGIASRGFLAAAGWAKSTRPTIFCWRRPSRSRHCGPILLMTRRSGALSQGDLTRPEGHPSECVPDLRGRHPSPGDANCRCRRAHAAGERPLLFFAMELLQGHTLVDRIRAGRLPREEAFPIAVQLAEGLQAAHRAGIVHADFKSANVILVTSPAGVRASSPISGSPSRPVAACSGRPARADR